MFHIGPKYVALKTSLQIASNRLKILQATKSEQIQRLRKEIANYIKNGKYIQARIKAEKLIRDEASVEGMEFVEMFCGQLLDRYELFKQMREPDVTLAIPISSLIWIVPYYQTQVPEMKTILKQLAAKYGSKFCRNALKNKNGNVCAELIERVRLSSLSDEKIENYLKNVCAEYGVTYHDQKEKKSKGNYLDNLKICDESKEMVNRVSEIVNKVRQQETQTEFHGKGTSEKFVFSKPMRIFKFHKTRRKNNVEAGKCTSSRDGVSVTSSCDNTNEYCRLNQSILSSNEKLNEPTARSDENLVQQNLKIEEEEKRNSPFLSKSEIYADSFKPLYQEPPPPYSQCIYDASNRIDTNSGMLDYFNNYQLPTCPSENPESDLLPESNKSEKEDQYST